MRDQLDFYITVKQLHGEIFDTVPAGNDWDGAHVRFEQECKDYTQRTGSLTVLIELMCKSAKGEHSLQNRLISNTSAQKVADFGPNPYGSNTPNNLGDKQADSH